MKRIISLCALNLFLISSSLSAADFNFTTPGPIFDNYFYNVNGQERNPTLTLTRGQTYTFAISTAGDHPVAIVTSGYSFEVPGVSGNDTSSGTITYVVPFDAPDQLKYICSLHYFEGQINIIDPPPPLAVPVKIVSISLTSSNVTLKSTGTNGFLVIPEFSSNLFSGSWTAVPGFSNSFSNGTNTSVFGRLEVICGPNVFLRVRSAPGP